MIFDPQTFEQEEIQDIAVNEGKVGKLNLLIYGALIIICVYYLFAEWSPTADVSKNDVNNVEVKTESQ